MRTINEERQPSINLVFVFGIIVCTLSVSDALSQTISQQTKGMCSPAVANVQGNVTMNLNCNGATGTVVVPAYKGSITSSKDVNRLVEFLRAKKGRVAFLSLDFDLDLMRWNWANQDNSQAEQADVPMCETAGDAALCISIGRTDLWQGGLIKISDYWTDPKCSHQKKVGIQCIPCSHGFCDVHGFVEIEDWTIGQGYIVAALDAIPTKTIIENPQLLLQKVR